MPHSQLPAQRRDSHMKARDEITRLAKRITYDKTAHWEMSHCAYESPLILHA